MLCEQISMCMHSAIYFSPKAKTKLKFANFGSKSLLHKIQLNFTPVVYNFFSTNRFLYLALQLFILGKVRLRDLEAGL